MSDDVRSMFTSIAARYDRANTLLSLGQHGRWRRRLVKMVGPPAAASVLDVATGTGDLAFEFRRAVGPRGRVVGVDFSDAMLAQGRAKASARNVRIDFQAADALRLPFAAGEFDVASVAFGIRNVDNPAKVLEEMARVVRPGGTVAVLEFGQPHGWMKVPYRLYSRLVIPRMGRVVTGNAEAYRYLPRTAAAFPSGEAFLDLMRSTDRFSGWRSCALSGGIVHAYLGFVKN